MIMVCNKLCDEHTITGSLSNLAGERPARVRGSQVSSRAHHPSIHSLFFQRAPCLGPQAGWRLTQPSCQPSPERPQATIITGIICSSHMLWPQGLDRPRPPPASTWPNLSCPGSVSSDFHISQASMIKSFYSFHFSVDTAWEKCDAD